MKRVIASTASDNRIKQFANYVKTAIIEDVGYGCDFAFDKNDIDFTLYTDVDNTSEIGTYGIQTHYIPDIQDDRFNDFVDETANEIIEHAQKDLTNIESATSVDSETPYELLFRLYNLADPEDMYTDEDGLDYCYTICDGIQDTVRQSPIGDGVDDISAEFQRTSTGMKFTGRGIVYTKTKKALSLACKQIEEYLRTTPFSHDIVTAEYAEDVPGELPRGIKSYKIIFSGLAWVDEVDDNSY